MKKIYLLLFTTLGFLSVTLAQPTLTEANFVPNVGESQLYYVADTNSVLDNATGADVVFDYSGLAGFGTTQTQHFLNPTTTPNSAAYPTATYVDTTTGFSGNLKYNQNFTDSLNTIGLILDISSIGVVIAKYDNNPKIVMKFPFNYGNSFTDAYGGKFTANPSAIPVPVSTNGVGSVTVTADAWGTLKLPMNPDIDSVLRVVSIENLLTDPISLQPFAPNVPAIPINITQTSYYKPSINKNPLISFIVTDINGDTSTIVVSQYPIGSVGVEEVNENTKITIFPNPTNNSTTTLTVDIENKATVGVTVFNHLGQKIKEIFNGNLQQGQNQLEITTSDLSSGIYIVNINIDSKIITKKLVIE